MDGLLINSEPYWQEAGIEFLEEFDVTLTLEQYQETTGLRSKEWLEYWFNYFRIDLAHAARAAEDITARATEKIRLRAEAMPGIDHVIPFFAERHFKIGLATSSPFSLIDVIVDKLGIRDVFSAYASAEMLPFSKPHPEVFMHCAGLLGSSPLDCICFEDSFNGLIAAKAARMKCVVVPETNHYYHPKLGASDLKISSLADFTEKYLLELD